MSARAFCSLHGVAASLQRKQSLSRHSPLASPSIRRSVHRRRSARCSAQEDPEAPGSSAFFLTFTHAYHERRDLAVRDYKRYGAQIEKKMMEDKEYPTNRLSTILYSLKIGDAKGVLTAVSKPAVTVTGPIVGLSLLWTLSTGKGLRALSGFGLDETALGVFEGSAFAIFAFFLYYEVTKFLDGVLGVSNRRKF